MFILHPIRAAFATLFHYLLFFVNILGYPAGLAAVPQHDSKLQVKLPATEQPSASAAPQSSDAVTTPPTSRTYTNLPQVKILSNVSAPTALQGMMLAVASKNIAKEVVRIVLSAYTPSASHRYTYEFYTANSRNLALPKRIAGLPVPEPLRRAGYRVCSSGA